MRGEEEKRKLRRFAGVGLVALIVLALAIGAWWNWDTFATYSPDQHEAPETANSPADSSVSEKPLDVWEEIKRWVYEQFGRPGLIVLLLIGLPALAWWKWQTIITLPGIAPIVKRLSQTALPKVDPRRGRTR